MAQPADVKLDLPSDPTPPAPGTRRGPSPEASASCLSRLLFGWVNPLFSTGNTRSLNEDDLFTLLPSSDAGAVSSAFEALLEARIAAGDASPVTSALTSQFYYPMLLAGVVKVLNSTCQFAPPLLLFGLLQSLASVSSGGSSHARWEPYVYAVALFAAICVRTVIENNYFHLVIAVGYTMREAITTAVYRKALRLSPTARQETPTGQIVNLMQLDATRLDTFMSQFHVVWDSPYQICGYMIILGFFVGYSALAGLASMLLLIPVNVYQMMTMARYRRATVAQNDQRIKVTNETLQGIRAIKLYNWEEAFTGIINAVRDRELTAIWNYSVAGAVNNTIMQTAPILVALVTLIVFAGSGGDFTAARVFSALTVLNQLRFPLMFLPMAISSFADARVSLQRLNKFMQQPEVQAYARRAPGDAVSVALTDGTPMKTFPTSADEVAMTSPDVGIAMRDGTFQWEQPAARVERLWEKAQADRVKAAADAKKAASPAVPVSPRGAPTSPTAAGAKPAQSQRAMIDVSTLPASKDAIAPCAPVLQNMNIVVPRGKLYAVVGGVGSGKSALISAVLGELHKVTGEVILNGRVAYVSQTAWILNATVKKNITFAWEAATRGIVEDARYQRILDVCQLKHDITTLPNGDATEIGERGINLSGGQKQRVSIARAAFSGADVYLFDDPLSALDAEVGKAVFERCIVGELAGHTRLLITNQLQYLRQCDGVIVLERDASTGSGRIACQGTYDDLIAHEPAFAALMREYGNAASSSAEDDAEEGQAANGAGVQAGASEPVARQASDKAKKTALTIKTVDGEAAGPAKPAKSANVLMTTEERNEGAVKFRVYQQYFRSAGSVALIIVVLLICYFFAQLSQLATQWWLTYWTSDSSMTRNPMGFYMGIFAAIGLSSALFAFIRVIAMGIMGIRASRVMHGRLLASILSAPLSFFDTTPLGRIIARFSKDMDAVDNMLVMNLGMLGMCVFLILGSVAAIVFATPWFALVIVPVIFIYIRVMNYFRNVAREVKRIDSVTRSPVYAHFSETLGGLSVIRAYNLAKEFAVQNESKVALNVSAYYTLRACDRWLSLRLELLGNTIILAAGLLAAGTASSRSEGSAAGLAGLSLSYALAITGIFNWTVRTFAETEQTMNSVERMLHYQETVPQEPYAPVVGVTIPAGWPSRGSIEFKNYHMRYRPTTPEVLRGVTFSVHGGEKIGIVGRTGAGKSSLMVALYRLIEDSCHTGVIEIDGVNIDTLGLSQLRSQLAIIPQDPVMFSGTVRSNLDPIGTLSHLPDRGDAQLWDAITKVGLKEVIDRLPGKLDTNVAEFGDNFSVGQRQLMCLARVLLRKCRLVLLDEASSALDFASDLALQRAIRESFHDCTILTIAHRLNTIISSDRVVCMDAGVVSEYAHPHELLGRSGSMFASLVDEMGPEAAAVLREQAAAAYAASQLGREVAGQQGSAGVNAVATAVAVAAVQSVAAAAEVVRE